MYYLSYYLHSFRNAPRSGARRATHLDLLGGPEAIEAQVHGVLLVALDVVALRWQSCQMATVMMTKRSIAMTTMVVMTEVWIAICDSEMVLWIETEMLACVVIAGLGG
jgi:hypothetical protein